jgi:hypothetical protein
VLQGNRSFRRFESSRPGRIHKPGQAGQAGDV